MAVVPTAPIPIPAPGTYSVPYPGGGTQPQGFGQWVTVKLENASPFPLTVRVGGTPVHTLPAGVADVFPITLGPSAIPHPTAGVDAPNQPITVVAGSPAPAVLANTPGALRASFGQYGDLFPGVYPITLPGVLSAAPTAGGSLGSFNTNVPAGSSVITPAVSVAAFAQVLISSIAAGPPAPIIWTVLWFLDAAETQQVIPVVAGDQNNWNTNGGLPHLAVFTVLAPYVALQAQAIAGGPYNIQGNFLGIPQPGGLLLPPQTQVDLQAVNLNANATNDTGPTVMTSGRFHLYAQLNTQTMDVGVQRFSSTGTWDYIENLTAVPAGSGGRVDFTAPLDEWRIHTHNTGAAAGSLFLGVTGPA